MLCALSFPGDKKRPLSKSLTQLDYLAAQTRGEGEKYQIDSKKATAEAVSPNLTIHQNHLGNF